MLGKRKTNTLLSNCHQSFFLFFFNISFSLVSGSTLIILLLVYQTIILPMFNVLQSATSQQHIGRLFFYLIFLLKYNWHAISRLLCLLISLPTHFTYLLKSYCYLYHKRKKQGGVNHDSSHWVLGIAIKEAQK